MGRIISFMKRSGLLIPNPGPRLLVAGVGVLVLSLAIGLGARARLLWSISPQAHSANEGGKISPEAARALEEKIQVLSGSDPDGSVGSQPIVITDLEANSYLKYHGREFLPPGVYSPEVHIQPGRISGTAEVDFNQLNQTGPKTDDWSASLLAMILKGRERVSAKGKLDTGNGQGKVTIEGVQLGTSELPDWLVSLLLENYVQKRYNIDLSKPLILPDHVTRIELGDGRAIFYRNPNKGR
jgi:hypothetical protein